MKNTIKFIDPMKTGNFLGTVRNIDDLGRIVIPSELRKSFDMPIGSALEIFATRTGQIVLQKYEPVVRLGECDK